MLITIGRVPLIAAPRPIADFKTAPPGIIAGDRQQHGRLDALPAQLIQHLIHCTGFVASDGNMGIGTIRAGIDQYRRQATATQLHQIFVAPERRDDDTAVHRVLNVGHAHGVRQVQQAIPQAQCAGCRAARICSPSIVIARPIAD
jgi:hypothetical protein